MPVFNLRNGTFSMSDGTGTPVTKTVSPVTGGVTISGIVEGGKKAIPVVSRGAFIEHVYGEYEPVKVDFEIFHDGDLTGSSVLDYLLKTGTYSTNITTDPGGEVYAHTVKLTEVKGSSTNVFICTYFRLEAGTYKEDIAGNKISFSGTANGGYSIT